jgi:hypothetical protein
MLLRQSTVTLTVAQERHDQIGGNSQRLRGPPEAPEARAAERSGGCNESCVAEQVSSPARTVIEEPTSVGVARPGLVFAGQPGGTDEFLVQFEPHRVIRVDEGPGEPPGVSGDDTG